MAITFGGLANMQSQSALAIGQSQASNLGLSEDEGNALAISNLMDSEEESLVSKLMGSGGSQNRLSGSALTEDLQDIAAAALEIGSGSGASLSSSSSSSLTGTGSILDTVT